MYAQQMLNMLNILQRIVKSIVFTGHIDVLQTNEKKCRLTAAAHKSDESDKRNLRKQ